MQAGEPIERAYWVCAGMSPDAVAVLLKDAIVQAFAAEGWAHSPVRYETLPADSLRLPPPPEFIRGKNPSCMLAWADAIAPVPVAPATGDMTSADLDKLRAVVRRRWLVDHPRERLSNEAADTVIDQLTPATVRALS